MKKFFCILAAIILMFTSFGGCADKNSTKDDDSTQIKGQAGVDITIEQLELVIEDVVKYGDIYPVWWYVNNSKATSKNLIMAAKFW